MVAIKVFKEYSGSYMPLVRNEMRTYQRLNQTPNNHILATYESGEGVLTKPNGKQRNVFYIVIEFARRSLLDYILLTDRS